MKKKDILVRVQLSGTRSVKMYKQDAIAKGLYKEHKQVENKMVEPDANKKVDPGVMVDFTTIPGIGVSASEKLKANGILSF